MMQKCVWWHVSCDDAYQVAVFRTNQARKQSSYAEANWEATENLGVYTDIEQMI